MTIHLTKPVKKRLLIFFIILIVGVVTANLILTSLKKNLVYFYSPTDLKLVTNLPSQKIRVGGMVEKGSLIKKDNLYTFKITDLKNFLNINYQGILPNLFVEGQGAVIEGKLLNRSTLQAESILAKHDENYMPKEISESLKQQGQWKKNYGK
jgi:cytochrome c-type biogenesis protein CcmE